MSFVSIVSSRSPLRGQWPFHERALCAQRRQSPCQKKTTPPPTLPLFASAFPMARQPKVGRHLPVVSQWSVFVPGTRRFPRSTAREGLHRHDAMMAELMADWRRVQKHGKFDPTDPRVPRAAREFRRISRLKYGGEHTEERSGQGGEQDTQTAPAITKLKITRAAQRLRRHSRSYRSVQASTSR